MEQEGWIRAEWGTTEKNREARFYSLTAKGRKQLAQEQANWARLTAGVARVIGYARQLWLGTGDFGMFCGPAACIATWNGNCAFT